MEYSIFEIFILDGIEWTTGYEKHDPVSLASMPVDVLSKLG